MRYSIVTAIKDGLAFFKETAPTVLAQTYRDWEWLIVDDGSTEPIAEYVKSLNDARIRLIRNATSIAQTKSLNIGIREAKGEWIVRMDGDDLASPRRLAAIDEALARAKRSGTMPYLVFSDYEVIHEDGTPVATVRYNPELGPGFYEYLEKQNNPIAHTTVAFRRQAPDGTLNLYDENLRNAQDYALWKKMRRDFGGPFTHVPEVTIEYRLVRQSLSVANAPEQKSELDAIRKADTRAAAARSPSHSTLTGAAREGMYAYRVLYYRFIGQARGAGVLLGPTDAHWLGLALRYPDVRAKALAYGLGRPWAPLLKRRIFGKIFL